MSDRFRWTSSLVSKVLGVEPSGGNSYAFTNISTDSRSLRPGELFVALKGEHFDGVDFVPAAVEAGARGIVADHCPYDLPDTVQVYLVDDALTALGDLATARRRALDPKVVAITGTTGKTTTRALLTAALGPRAYGSPGNYNNLVGVPLSILGAPEDAEVWVLELASNQPGEIERLGRITEPEYAVITSVSEGHLQGLGDLRGVMSEKLSLLSTLKEGGQAWVGDEPAELSAAARAASPAVRVVGLDDSADERPDVWSVSPDGVTWSWRGVEFNLRYVGAHFVRDAMMALVIATELGGRPSDLAERLRRAELPPMRSEVRRLGELRLLADCYNANPSSFRAALESLDALAGGRRRRCALVGSMLELGARSQALHELVADWMLDMDIEVIAATGEFENAFRQVASSTRENLILESSLEDAYRGLAERLNGDEVVLLKASRGMKFERAIPLFERDFGEGGDVKVSGANV